MTSCQRACAALAAACLLLLTGCKEVLHTGLSEREANEQVALLLRQGIPASREANAKDHTVTVSVEGSRFADAVDALRAAGLPRQRHASFREIFKGDSLVPSPSEERARKVFALGEELARTISEIDGVLAARVHIVEPEHDPLQRDAPLASASVLVTYVPDAGVQRLVPQIKQLVANGAAGLSYDRVSVVLVPSEHAMAQPMPGGSSGPDLTQVVGLWVLAGSAGPLYAILASGAALIIALAALAGWLAWRRRSGGPRLLALRQAQ